MSEQSPEHKSICQEYEAQWSWESAGPAGLLQFLKSIGAQGKSVPLIDLIRADMYCVWSNWADRALEHVEQELPVDVLMDHWKALPRFQNYSALFHEAEAVWPHWQEMASAECYCRDRWGDAVGPAYYLHHFQAKTEEFLRRTRRHMRCEFESNKQYSQVLFPLRGHCEIGRQRTTDQEPYFFEAKPDGNRLVIASRIESEVSREQLSLQLLTPMVVIITNRSNVNSLRINPDYVLGPGEQLAAVFPFTIFVPGRRLCCY